MARYIGNYQVLRELGTGHFGTVYLAVGEVPGRRDQPPRRRIVAIKKLNDASPRAVRLLVQEFALLDQVKHRSVVRVFEFLEDESAVVMEYIHGVSLRQMLVELASAREQVFTEASVEIASEIADALYQAFTTPGDNGEPLQLVHRDLKPANIMLTPSGEVKVLDWGLARVDNSDFRAETRGRIKGTMLYMAPEQAQGLEVDHRTDIFALGLILYELLEGRSVYQVPKDNSDPVEALKALIRDGNTQRASNQLESRLPAIGPIITHALQVRPEDRYRSGQDMMVDLRRQLYRDRGAYLEEFCEFFFGSIHDIGSPVTLDSLSGSSDLAQRARDHVSVEERMRQSIAHEQDADERAQHHDRTPHSTPGLSQASSRVSRGRTSTRAHDSSPPRPPPVGMPDSRRSAMPPPPPGHSGVKTVGQRNPNETGMLEMVPLSGSLDPAESGVDPSATAFFALPATASRGSNSPPPVPSGGPVAPPAAPALPPRGTARPGLGGPPPPPAAPSIRGPVAPQTGTPFQVEGPTPSSGSEENRVNSTRVFAVLFAVFLLVCMALLIAVINMDDNSRSDSAGASEAANRSGSELGDGDDFDDWAESEDEEDEAEEENSSGSAKSSSSRGGRSSVGASGSRSGGGSSGGRTGSSGSGGSSSQGSAVGSGGLTLKVGAPYRNVKGSCGGKSIGTTSISGNRVSLGTFSVGTECDLQFSGGGPAQARVLFTYQGRLLNCTGVATTMKCK